MSRLYSRRRNPSVVTVGATVTPFSTVKIGANTNGAAILAAYAEVYELGNIGILEDESTAGNATVTNAVPAGKYWRLIGFFHRLVTDANVANRAVVIKTRESDDTVIETITHANVAASTTVMRTTLFATDDHMVGSEGVAAQGTLTIAEPVTDTDPFILNGTTFTMVDALTGAANEIYTGGTEAATKLAMNAAFVDRDNGGTLHSVTDAVYAAIGMTAIDFAADDMVFTANVKGTAGNALATTETFTHGSNVFDATTLGTTTAGVDQADKVATLDYPTAGPILTPLEDVNISVTNGVAGDSLDTYMFYIEYDADPR